MKPYLVGNREFKINVCFRYIAYIKWKGHAYYCKGKKCSGGHYKSRAFEIVTYEHIPYSRKCLRCGHIESPTAGTALHSIKHIPVFFEMVQLIIGQKKLNRRLSDTELYQIIKGEDCEYYQDKKTQDEFLINLYKEMLNDESVGVASRDAIKNYQKQLGTSISDSFVSRQTISNYRKRLQPFIIDWSHFSDSSKMPYAVVKFYLNRGATSKVVIVATQLCPNGFIRSSVYNKDNYSNLLHFLQNNIGDTTNILIFDWGKEYNSIKNKIDSVEFRNGEMPYKNIVIEIADKLQFWLQGIDLTNNVSIQQAINECIYLLYYNYLSFPQLMHFLIGIGKPEKSNKIDHKS
jgi:hypothetical protein